MMNDNGLVPFDFLCYRGGLCVFAAVEFSF